MTMKKSPQKPGRISTLERRGGEEFCWLARIYSPELNRNKELYMLLQNLSKQSVISVRAHLRNKHQPPMELSNNPQHLRFQYI